MSGWDAEGRYREAKEGWIILICKLGPVIQTLVLPLTTSLPTTKLKEKFALTQGSWCFRELKEKGLNFTCVWT